MTETQISAAAQLARFAETMAGSADESDCLTAITLGAVELIPGAEHAGVLVLVADSELAGRCEHGPLPGPVLAAQNAAGQGPCIDASHQSVPVVVPDFRAEARWPGFVPLARDIGVGSMLCTPLLVGTTPFGSLSLIAGAPHAFDAESQSLAAVFATHAAIALSGAATRASLNVALESRDVIGQAKGILMERHGLSATQAFAALVKASQHNHQKLRDVAAELASTGRFAHN